MSPELSIVVQRLVDDADVPSDTELAMWATAAVGQRRGEVVLRIVGAEESATLNSRFRGKGGPTNVLAFAGPECPAVGAVEAAWPLGDLVLCRELVAAEAAAAGTGERARWAHLVVHGCLHLLGFDHEESGQAAAMEAAEAEILRRLGFPDPYSPGTMSMSPEHE